jgi:hypothetical protein
MRIFFLALVLALSDLASAQGDFAVVWQADHGFKPSVYKSWDDDATLFFAASDDKASMIGADGKVLWKADADKYGLKEFSAVTWFRKPGIIRLVQPESKKQPAVSVFVDAKTGNELWRSDKITWIGFDGATIQESYLPELNATLVLHGQKLLLVNLSTGKPYWEINNYVDRKIKTFECFHPDGMNILEVVVDQRERSYFDLTTGQPVSKITSSFYKQQRSSLYSIIVSDEDMHVRLDYKKRLIRKQSGAKTPMTLTARRFSTGDVLWTTEFEANLVTTVASLQDMVKFFVSNDRVFVVFEGISVFDLKTGKLLWKSEFNNSEVDNGLTKVKQQINIADLPLVDGNAVYIVDLTKETYGIKKVDATTGNIIWKTDKFSSSDVIPSIQLVNGFLVAQFGGVINNQTYIHTDKVEKWTSTYKFRGNAGIKVFDPATGKLVWDEKKLGEKLDFISPFLFEKGNVYFFTDRSYFAMDVATGAVKQQVSLKDLKMGEPIQLIMSDDKSKIYSIMEKGVCGIDIVSGKVLYSTAVKDVTNWFKRGDNYFLVIGDDQDEFVGFDIATGKLKGKHDGDADKLSVDGEYVIDIDWGKIKKYRVN